MNKQQIIERLEATLEKLKALPDEKFSYQKYVTVYDRVKRCGTVCCIAGWYPLWFPHAGLRWSNVTKDIMPVGEKTSVRKTLVDYHSISIDIVEILFFGNYNIVVDDMDIDTNHDIDASKETVERVWQRVIDCFKESDKFDEYLIIES